MTGSIELRDVRERAKNAEAFARFIAGYDQVRQHAPLPHFESYMMHDQTIDLLANATLFEPRGEGEVIYRFCGTAVVARSGRDLTGENLIAFWSEDIRVPFYQHLMTLIGTPCGNFAKLHQVFASGARVYGESLTLPVLSKSNASGVFLLACTLMDQAALGALDKGDHIVDMEWLSSYIVDVGHGAPVAVSDAFRRKAG